MKKIITDTAAKTATLFSLFLFASGSLFAQSTGSTKDNVTSGAASANPQTVNAQQSGPWTVGIDPAKNTVQLANSEADPLSVKLVGNGAVRKPFQRRVVVTIPAGYGVGSSELYIPTGKRLIIENLSAVARVPQGQYPYMQLFTFFDSGDTVLDPQDIAYHQIALVEQGLFTGQTTSTANHKVLIFADERVATNGNLGVSVSFGVSGTVTQPTVAEVTLSGYLEDKPTNP